MSQEPSCRRVSPHRPPSWQRAQGVSPCTCIGSADRGRRPAGIAAALKLARAGVRVLVLEAPVRRAENWSGCVYHADALVREDVLGAAAWAEAPKERRVTARSLFLHDGSSPPASRRAPTRPTTTARRGRCCPKLDRCCGARHRSRRHRVTNTTVTGLRTATDAWSGQHRSRPGRGDCVFIARAMPRSAGARGLERVARPHYARGEGGVQTRCTRDRAPLRDRPGRRHRPGVDAAQRQARRAQRAPQLRRVPLYQPRHAVARRGVPARQLAHNAVADHPQCSSASSTPAGRYLEGGQQVAYGASDPPRGVDETRRGARRSRGRGGLGLGLRFRIRISSPAITTGISFAEAVLAIRGRGADYTRAELERDYVARLKATPTTPTPG